MTNDAIKALLTAYCGSDYSFRDWYRRPVKLGNHAFSTNGAALVRVPLSCVTDGDLPDSPLSDLNEFIFTVEQNTFGNPFNLPAMPPADICPECAAGKVWQCPVCQGDDSLANDCAECKGEPDSATEIEGWTFRDCWFCDGRGEVQQDVWIGPALFDRRLIAPLVGLPEMVFRLDHKSPAEMAAFARFETQFGEGQAVIMPMRQSRRTAKKEAT